MILHYVHAWTRRSVKVFNTTLFISRTEHFSSTEMEPDPQGNKTSETPKKEMTKEDASRIQRAEAKKHDGEVKKGDFAPRAQAAADKHENEKK